MPIGFHMTRKYMGGSRDDAPAVMPFNVYRTQQILNEDNKYRKGEYDLAQRQIKSWAFDPTQQPARTLQLTEQQQYALSIYVNRFINEIDRYLDHFLSDAKYDVSVSPVSIIIRWNDLANYFSVYAGKNYTDIVINTLLQNDVPNKIDNISNSLYNPEIDEDEQMRLFNDVLTPILKIATNINSNIIEPVSIPLVDFNSDSGRFFSIEAPPEEGGMPPPEGGMPPPRRREGRPKLLKSSEIMAREAQRRAPPAPTAEQMKQREEENRQIVERAQLQFKERKTAEERSKSKQQKENEANYRAYIKAEGERARTKAESEGKSKTAIAKAVREAKKEAKAVEKLTPEEIKDLSLPEIDAYTRFFEGRIAKAEEEAKPKEKKTSKAIVTIPTEETSGIALNLTPEEIAKYKPSQQKKLIAIMERKQTEMKKRGRPVGSKNKAKQLLLKEVAQPVQSPKGKTFIKLKEKVADERRRAREQRVKEAQTEEPFTPLSLMFDSPPEGRGKGKSKGRGRPMTKGKAKGKR